MKDLYTTFEASKILGISVSTVQRYFDAKKLYGEIGLFTGRRKICLQAMYELADRHSLIIVEKGGEPKVVVAGCPSDKYKQLTKRQKRKQT